MTLEIVIMLLLVINIYAYISRPLSEVSMAATESIGVSAMAVKAVDTIANKVNLVGVGGSGATDQVRISTFEDFDRISCSNLGGKSVITIAYETYNATFVSPTEAFGSPAVTEKKDFTYSRSVDFPVSSCNIGSIQNEEGHKCIKVSNNLGTIALSSC